MRKPFSSAVNDPLARPPAALGTGGSGHPVSLPEDRGVVARVAGHHPGEGAHRHRLAARDPELRPLAGVEAEEEGQVRLPDEVELLDQLPQRDRVRSGGVHVVVLVEGGERRLLAATEAEGPVAEHALGVDQVAEHLADVPLPSA